LNSVLSILVYRLLTEPLHEALVRHRTILRKAVERPKNDPATGVPPDDDQLYRVLGAILDYDEENRQCPQGWQSLWEYCADHPKFGDLRSQAETIRVAAENLLRDFDPFLLGAASDINVLVQNVLVEARRMYYVYIGDMMRIIAYNSPDAGAKRAAAEANKESGCDAAKQAALRLFAKDFGEEIQSGVEGIWQENTEALEARFAEYMAGRKLRVWTGFRSIDKNTVLRLGKTLTIAGNSGDGKTLFLNSLIYNMARRGERILYNALEFSVEETWENLAFIHCHSFRDRTFLPSQALWRQHDPASGHQTVTDRDYENMRKVISDIKESSSVPGLIDVVRKFEWEDLEQYYEANDQQNHYTAVVVDYVGFFQVEFRNESEKVGALDTLISRIVQWVHLKDKFLFVTPAQVKKSAAERAYAQYEKDQTSGGYDSNSLYYGTALRNDGDIMMWVFSPDGMKLDNEMRVGCAKHRNTDKFPDHILRVDPRTKMVYDPMGSDYTAHGGDTAGTYDEGASDLLRSLYAAEDE
jgi:replicative DNA helicase